MKSKFKHLTSTVGILGIFTLVQCGSFSDPILGSEAEAATPKVDLATSSTKDQSVPTQPRPAVDKVHSSTLVSYEPYATSVNPSHEGCMGPYKDYTLLIPRGNYSDGCMIKQGCHLNNNCWVCDPLLKDDRCIH